MGQEEVERTHNKTVTDVRQTTTQITVTASSPAEARRLLAEHKAQKGAK